MIVISHVLGNVKTDPVWVEKLKAYELDYLTLEHGDMYKNSCRKMTEQGKDLGISLERNSLLADGDVLLCDDKHAYAIIVKLILRDVMIIDLTDLLNFSHEMMLKISFELGHALGNQHWKSIIHESQVFVPLSVSHKVMESVIQTHRFTGIHYRFEKGDSILSCLTPSEARLLFGGAEDLGAHVHVDHSHSHDFMGHSHEHEGHRHVHNHAGNSHDNEHDEHHSRR
ncbi:urease accessory protein UreE [Edwardsiella ictaluri]|uniref:urease accessory protein UreE n=1 Tax=Edwardsiella ictaluri TaxID=67780 RepID=UPI003783C647